MGEPVKRPEMRKKKDLKHFSDSNSYYRTLLLRDDKSLFYRGFFTIKDPLMSAVIFHSLRPNLGLFLPLGKSRVETLSVLVIGLVMGRTVNLPHLASQFPGPTKVS